MPEQQSLEVSQAVPEAAATTAVPGGGPEQAGVTPAAAAPQISGPTEEEITARVIGKLTGGRTTDPAELAQYLTVADNVIASLKEQEYREASKQNADQEEEAIAARIAEEFKKKGSAAKGLAWLMSEGATLGAKIALDQVEKREAHKMSAAQKADAGRIRFFQDHPHLLQHAQKVDAMVSRGIAPTEVADLLKDFIPANGTATTTPEPENEPSVPGFPGLTRSQIESMLRTTGYVQPHVLKEQKRFSETDEYKKMADRVSAKIDKAESPEDVWAALAEYDPGKRPKSDR
jgi:hypothetical protein